MRFLLFLLRNLCRFVEKRSEFTEMNNGVFTFQYQILGVELPNVETVIQMINAPHAHELLCFHFIVCQHLVVVQIAAVQGWLCEVVEDDIVPFPTEMGIEANMAIWIRFAKLVPLA